MVTFPGVCPSHCMGATERAPSSGSGGGGEVRVVTLPGLGGPRRTGRGLPLGAQPACRSNDQTQEIRPCRGCAGSAGEGDPGRGWVRSCQSQSTWLLDR